MRICVTVEALTVHFSMDHGMTFGTARHNDGVIVFARIVGMKCCMTLTTIKLVPAALSFEVEKMARVTLATLLHCQRLRINGIKLRILWRQIQPR